MPTSKAWTEVATPTGRTYLVGPAQLGSRKGIGPFGVAVYPFGFDVYKAVGGSCPVHVAMTDAEIFTSRVQELSAALAAGTWAPPEFSPKVAAGQAKVQATNAFVRERPVLGTARLAIRVSIFVLLVLALVMAWRIATGDMLTAAMIPKAVLLIGFLSAAYGAVSAWAIRRYG
jgi:hypothetical protein